MFTPPVHQKKRTSGSVSVLSPYLRHLNTGTLAFLLFVALALLSTTRGKELESRESAPKAQGRDSRRDYRSELSQGSLEVYSATDAFDDGDVFYYAHSSYAIFTADGKLFKNVENHISRSDEIPEVVALPVGSYVVEARSEQDGYVRLRVAIRAGHRTILDLDLGDKESPSRIAHN